MCLLFNKSNIFILLIVALTDLSSINAKPLQANTTEPVINAQYDTENSLEDYRDIDEEEMDDNQEYYDEISEVYYASDDRPYLEYPYDIEEIPLEESSQIDEEEMDDSQDDQITTLRLRKYGNSKQNRKNRPSYRHRKSRRPLARSSKNILNRLPTEKNGRVAQLPSAEIGSNHPQVASQKPNQLSEKMKTLTYNVKCRPKKTEAKPKSPYSLDNYDYDNYSYDANQHYAPEFKDISGYKSG